jgi:hypothetical protein
MAESAGKHNNRIEATRTAALKAIEHELADAHARLTEQRAQRQAAIRELKLARAVASDLSWELADLEQRLRDLLDQREGPADRLRRERRWRSVCWGRCCWWTSWSRVRRR